MSLLISVGLTKLKIIVGYETPSYGAASYLLLETADFLLLESGDKLLLG